MTNKRPTIKGKGADFFFEKERIVPIEQGKVTFYLPEVIIDKLDNIWLDLRRAHRKLKKSDIARIALEGILQDYEDEHQNSNLVQCLNVKKL